MRSTETVTLHFDLSHLDHLPDDQEFSLKALGRSVKLRRHDQASLRAHRQRNLAVAALPDAQLPLLTHYVEEVELPSDAVGFHWVGYPSTRPGAVSDEIAVVFQHVPQEAVRRAVRAMRRDGSLPGVPGSLAQYGLAGLAEDADLEQFHVDASNTVNYIQTALTMIMQHPEIGTLVPDLHYRIGQQLVVHQPAFTQLWQYLSTHPAEGNDPWYENTYVTDPAGNVMSPDQTLTDKDGQPVVWPTATVGGRQVSVIPQHRLSDGLNSVLKPAVQAVGIAVKQQPWLKGQQWSTQHGVTQLQRTRVSPSQSPRRLADAAGATQADWTIVNQTSQYGLDLYQDSISFDASSNILTFDVKNWPNRGLGAYVQFLDPDGNPIANPPGWQDRLPSALGPVRDWLEPNNTKWFLQHIGAGSVFFGAPVWAPHTSISFVVPEQATGANVLVGGLGNGGWDLDVDKVGLIYTCVASYGVPTLLSILSVGVQSTAWYMDFFDKLENVLILVGVGMGPFGILLGVGTVTIGVEATLIAAAQFVAGVIFSAGLAALAGKITGYVTAAELAENAPFVGWALRVASQASAIADMLATSIEVGLSPATYQLQAKRSMTLNVTVSPDPTHGTSTQKPIWPDEADHYVIMVQYKGGTTLTKAGPLPGQEDEPISVTYATATGDALPSAPGQQFQIVANIYSSTNWLCGKWVSGWVEAVPTDGDARSETGSIIEQLVPLSPSTVYSHEAKLNYDSPSKSYVWLKTTFSLSDTLEGSLVPGPVTQALQQAFWSHGVRLSTGATVAGAGAGRWQVTDPDTGTIYDIVKQPIVVNGETVGYELAVQNSTQPVPQGTVNILAHQDVQQLIDVSINDLAYKLGYCYLAANQNLPEDYGTTNQSSAMYLFESISTLANPGSGMLAPTRGFSLQPYIAYDQFGPAGLFRFDAATYQPELDKGGAVPDDVAALFTNAGFPLPAGSQITVVTTSASWQIGYPGQPPVYDLRRQVDVIVVFVAPAPAFSPNNFYLDTRTYQADGVAHLRLVDLQDNAGSTFDYDATQSWGSFDLPNLNAVAIHPNGFAIAISFQDDKMAIVQLPAAGVPDAEAPQALPFSGTGVREGLMQGPVGLTISADGRILVLERINARIQAFDTQANPVQCFASPLRFTVPASLVGDFNATTASVALLQALQTNVPVMNSAPGAYDPRYLLTPVFSMPASFATILDAGTVTDGLAQQFEDHALALGGNPTIIQTTEGVWLLQDSGNGVNYDVRLNGEGLGEVDVYRCFTPTILVKASGSEWTLLDKTNTLSFDVTAPAAGQPLQVQNLTSLMALKDGPSDTVTYLDVAIETKGFIYVLSYVDDGSSDTDYRLDIYNPDGSPLSADPASHNGQVNAARMTVDQWRTLFTLNYEQMSGPAGRPEPTVSQWLPTTPSNS